VSKISQGGELADRAGQTMGEILESVQRVTGIMADITAASEEQNSGISQVNAAVSQMHETTQQNASLVEEAAAAASSLHAQAEALFDAMRVFKLEEQPAPEAPAAPARPLAPPAGVRALAHAA
jgi:methyl-accepting chemotaxis protein